MERNLKTCPFCGSDGEHYPDGEEEGYVILCSRNRDANSSCPLGRFGFDTAEEAEAAWNQRADSATQPQTGD